MTRLLCAIGVSLWAVSVAAGQAAPPATLSNEARAQLQNNRFDVVTSLRGFPLGVRDALTALFGGGNLDIAEPGAPFRQSGGTGTPGLPPRRMINGTCSNEWCLLYYERGGASPTRKVLLFHWTPTATRLEFGGAAPAGLATGEDVRKAVLSGAIKASSEPY
ncbi:MAG TPA: hypothetical protein VFO31_07520 [Vicinamibacterales bacterium]|nr:hypothetical protein [Vicinamibacterales bacterium]